MVTVCDIGYRLDTVDIDMILLIDIGFCCRYDSVDIDWILLI